MSKSMFGLMMLAAVAVMCTGCAQRVVLFNGKDFTGWKLHVDDKNVNVDDVWSVADGVVHCAGKPKGYMRTLAEYSNYKLHVEWRWVAEPTNSGVLLHAGGEDKVWPRCIEAQLKAGNAGDFVLIGHTGVTVGGKKYQDDEKMYVVVAKKHDSTEKAPGKWNEYDIHCEGDSILLYVNGLLQNGGRKATDTKGWICLQSEGSPIEFRNIYIEPLKPK
ncbi:MAG: DUF1080 domain-containing protein [Planctomycetota bacterium]|nr:MAG: DUF1080 domain-containing protein [Planctomycetota bacterium]